MRSVALDVDTYLGRAARLDMSGIDLASFATSPLSPETLRCLRYMHDVECHTVCYLRDLLVTSAHRDPEMTTFLTLWNYEELFHGEAIANVLAAHGELSGRARVTEHRRSLGARDRLMPLAHALASWVVGPSFGALHMTWGALNEWCTQAGYALLAARSGHATLSELLRRIMRQEGMHIDFYSSRAARFLEASPRARRLTRLALLKLWTPVGASVMPDSEVRFVITHLFSGPDGLEMARRVDRRVDHLPGLSDLHLAERAVGRLAAI
jgi:hypothetical protein